MDDIKIFESPMFGQVRIIEDAESNQPLFCAADVCNALGFTNPWKAVSDHVDDPDLTKRYIGVVTGKKADGTDAVQKVKTNFVTESGLYSLIFGSKLERAKEFKRWVTSEVLPVIRKDGGYMTIRKDENEEDLMARALIVAQRTLKRREERIKQLEHTNLTQQKQLEEQEPKVNFADAMLASKTSCLVGELAKIITQNGYKIGQNRLFQWLRDNNYLGKWGERKNIPLQQYVEQGLFKLKKGTYTDSNGSTHTTTTVKVTGKGQQYFINKFLNNK